jgi:hypothetical protein
MLKSANLVLMSEGLFVYQENNVYCRKT